MRAVILLVLMAACAQAGELSKVSAGIALEYSAATSATFVPFQSKAGNIQGANTGAVYGIGIVAVLRPGEILSGKLSSFALLAGLHLDYGREKEDRFDSNLAYYAPDGSSVLVQNASSTRRTTTVETGLHLPLRWYPASSTADGGVYVEAGPGWIKSNKDVDLQVNGYVQAVPTTINEAARITSTVRVIDYGIGYTAVYNASQATFGVAYQQVLDEGRGVSNRFRVHITWTF